jgi:hypothetical protein
MGSSQSSLGKPTHDVFHKELEKLNGIITKIITNDDKFLDPNYNFLFEDTCNKYTILWEKDLKKHMKIHLEQLQGDIYLIPKKDHINTSVDESDPSVITNESVTKHELCSSIARHYVKILYILSLIKHVYDLESNGDNSLAGIMERNIKITEVTFELSYCSIPHKNYDVQHADKIDFSLLEGLEMYTKYFLSSSEKYGFIEQLKRVFARKPRHQILDIVCQGAVLKHDDYEKIYKRRFDDKGTLCKSSVPNKRVVRKNIDMMFEIAEMNPILHSKYCFSRRKISIPITNKKDPHVKKLLLLYGEMKTHYMDNVDEVIGILNKIVEPQGDKMILKQIHTQELFDLVQSVKKTVAKFYLQSIVDYQVLLDYAKNIPQQNVTSL